MMTEATGDYLVAGNQIVPVHEIHNYVLDRDSTVYEVLRLIDAKALFIEDHIDRFIRSFLLLRTDITSHRQQIINGIRLLIESNDLIHGNIRFQFNNNDTNRFCAWFVPAKYPVKRDYREGVPIMTFIAARPTPNVKSRNIKLRQDTDQFIRQHKIYEAILVNEQGHLTEGSRSNIFFIHDNSFVTPPLFQVLPGVTRQKVIELIRKNHMKFIEKTILLEEAERFSTCFITSTSAKVLPVSSFNNRKTDVTSKQLLKISELYNMLIDNYLENFTWPDF